MAKTKQKIVIDARRLRQTTGRYVRELLNSLQKIDKTNEYHVIIHEDDVNAWKPSAKNFKLHVVPWDHYTFGEQLSLPRYIKALSPDLVHYTMPQQPTLSRLPHVTTVHDMTLVNYRNPNKNSFLYIFKQGIFKLVLRRAVKSSDKVFTDANYTKKEICKYARVGEDKVEVIYLASDAMPKKTEQYKPAKDKQFIMYAGNAFPYKNLPRLMKSHQQLLKRHPKLHLFIVGKLDKDILTLQEIVRTNDYKNVEFTGFISDEELTWMYQNAQAYVFPSLSEGFGMPGLEAMQFDLPVVSSNATCLPEIYGKAAHYFNPKEINSMNRAINEVLTDKTLREELIEKGRKQIAKYSWSEMAKKTHAQYLEVLED